jgi:hypothetical protein
MHEGIFRRSHVTWRRVRVTREMRVAILVYDDEHSAQNCTDEAFWVMHLHGMAFSDRIPF